MQDRVDDETIKMTYLLFNLSVFLIALIIKFGLLYDVPINPLINSILALLAIPGALFTAGWIVWDVAFNVETNFKNMVMDWTTIEPGYWRIWIELFIGAVIGSICIEYSNLSFVKFLSDSLALPLYMGGYEIVRLSLMRLAIWKANGGPQNSFPSKE